MSDRSRLNIVVEHLDRLKGGGHRRLSFENLREIAAEVLVGHSFISVCFKSSATFVRARVFSSQDEIEKSIVSVDDMLSPKPEMSKHYGRCNWPGNPILYTSVNSDIAFSEARILKNQFICMAELVAKENLFAVVVGEVDRLRRTGSTLVPVAEANARKILDKGDLASLIVDAFLNDLLTMPCTHPSDYKLTSAFCAEIYNPPHIGSLTPLFPELRPTSRQFDDHDVVDAICYVSVAHRGGVNFAFKPKAYDKYLDIQGCSIWELKEDYDYGIYVKEKKSSAKVIEGGKILWK